MKRLLLTLLILFAFMPLYVDGGQSELIKRPPWENPDPPPDPDPLPDNRPPGDGVNNKYAIIIGISDYEAISDLSYCDEDATDWYNYLSQMGYDILLFGDHSNYFPQFDGLATEYNVKSAVRELSQIMDSDDTFVYTSSGHGTYAGRNARKATNQVICMWDCASGENGEDGYLFDIEMQDMFAPVLANTFVFLDHCFSGGMNECLTGWMYLTTTCTALGYGYDMPSYVNGAWTYIFLEYTLIGHFDGNVSMEEAFDYALSVYPFDGSDIPMSFDGNPELAFYI